MSDPSNPFKSLADSLLSDASASAAADASASSTETPSITFEERVEAFFSTQLLQDRLQHLSQIGVSQNPSGVEFISAVAEEDPDPLLRIAATIQLIRLGQVEELKALLELFFDELENPRTYSLGLMILDELPPTQLVTMIHCLMEVLPDDGSNLAALMQLVRIHQPEALEELLPKCLDDAAEDLDQLDEDIWTELVYALHQLPDAAPSVRQVVEAYTASLSGDHPRRLDFDLKD